MNDKAFAFLEKNHSAGMITLRKDGTPHAVRIAFTLVDGKIWSSGTQSRLRTKHLRRDPRCTLFVFEEKSGNAGYLGLECSVTILDDPDAADLNLRYFETLWPDAKSSGKYPWMGKEMSRDEFREAMVKEGRLIYEFEPQRAYGFY